MGIIGGKVGLKLKNGNFLVFVLICNVFWNWWYYYFNLILMEYFSYIVFVVGVGRMFNRMLLE